MCHRTNSYCSCTDLFYLQSATFTHSASLLLTYCSCIRNCASIFLQYKLAIIWLWTSTYGITD